MSSINENMENTRSRARLSSLATYRAFSRLRTAHQDEYTAYYVEEAERLGVNVRPSFRQKGNA